MLQVNTHLDALANQPAVHRIHIVLHVDHAAAGYRHAQPFAGLQTLPRQRSQQCTLLGQPLRAPGIPQSADVLQQHLVLLAASKIATATKQQRLIHRVLEMPMQRLHVAILVGCTRLNLLPA
jgi:hypothetical protein